MSTQAERHERERSGRTECGSGDPYPSRVSDTPLVSPRTDPVIWSAAWAPSPLTDLQRSAYTRNGFLILPSLFAGQDLEALRALAPGRLDTGKLDPETVIREPGSDAVRSVFEIHRQSDVAAAVVRDPRLLQVARFILGGDVYIHQSRVNLKPGFDGKEFDWHSDFETWHVEDGMPRMRALSMSVLLTDNESYNGPLMFIRRSHDFFVSCVGATPDEHFRQSLRKQEYGVPDHVSMTALAERGGIECAIAPAGSVVIFDCNLLHGSAGNLSPFPRSNLFFVYNATSNACVEPRGGTAPRPQHVANREYIEPLS